MIIQQFLEQIEEMKINLIKTLNKDELIENLFLKEAHETFSFFKEQIINKEEIGFNDWLLHDFKDSKGKGLVDYTEKNELSEVFKNSRVSFYSVMKIEKKVVLKDLFDRTDYRILNDENFDENSIYFARLYPYSGGYVISDDYYTYSLDNTSMIVKTVSEKFKETREILKYQSISEFINNNSLILFALVNIIGDVELDYVQEEYNVNIMVYTHKNKNKMIEIITNNKSISNLYENIYQYTVETETLMEIVINENTIEFEYLDDYDKQQVKRVIEEVFGDHISFEKEHAISFDELF
jgi:hypothetical protein